MTWPVPNSKREYSLRFWRTMFSSFTALLVGIAGTIGFVMSLPFLLVTPPEYSDEFLYRMDGWIDEQSARMDELADELDRLDAWEEQNDRA